MQNDEVSLSEPVDFSYYKPINENQKAFHKSKVKNKLLIGAYRSGKTYPAIHEALFICFDNPDHEFAVLRNTWDSLKDNVEKDFIRIAKQSKALLKWDKTQHDLTLKNNTIVRFRPLSMKRHQLKGMNLCGFLIDDPDVNKHKETIAFLFTRLTNPPNVKAAYFATIICANYEGHNWLWKMYMRRRNKGDNNCNSMFAYWFCKTVDNPTLDSDYIPIQEALHSKAWMDRYIHGVEDSYAGLVFDEYTPKVHDRDLAWCVDDNNLHKQLIIDLGITHPTVVLKIATDFKNLYIYDEWYQVGIRTANLGEYLLKLKHGKEIFAKTLIDPKSCAKEQTSGTSPRKILKDDYGIRVHLANNNIRYGIEVTKGLFTVRQTENSEGNLIQITHIYVDPVKCPNTIRELESLMWVEPEMTDFDELAYKEIPEDKDNDCTDCVRYACVDMRKYLRGLGAKERMMENRIADHRRERLSKLRYYKDKPMLKRMNETKQLRELHYGKGFKSRRIKV